MKKIPLLLATLLASFFCFAQQRQADSLQKLLTQHFKEDTVRVKLLTELATTYKDINPATSTSFASDAIALATRLNSRYWLARSRVAKAVNLLRQSRNNEALQLLGETLASYGDVLHEKDKAGVQGNIATVYYQKADFIHAAEYDIKAKDIYERLHDSASLVSSLNNIGTDYMLVSDYINTYRYLQEEQKIAEALHDTASLINMYANFVEVYNSTQEFETALENAEKSLLLANKTGNQYIVMAMRLSIGQIYYFMHNISKAAVYYNQVANDPILPDYEAIKAFTYVGLGDVKREQGQYKAALDDFEIPRVIYEKSGDKMNLSLVLNKIGNVYSLASSEGLQKQGIHVANRLQSALDYQKKAIAYAEETGAILRTGQMYQDISQVYRQQGLYRDAFVAFEKGAKLKDSLLNDDNKRKLSKMAIQYEYNKHEDSLNRANANDKARAALKFAKEQTKNRTLLLISGLVFITGVLSFMYYRRRKKAITQKQITDLETKAMLVQMNPHFIFNTLNSINDSIRNNPDTASYFTIKFSKLMRRILENSEHRQITLANEMETLNTYLQLEAARFENHFTYELTVDKSIDANNTWIPPMLMQPFLENSIVHGFEGKKETGKIFLHISKENSMLKCLIEDNGIGIPVKEISSGLSLTEKKSLGMNITIARVNLLNRVKKTSGKVEVFNLAQGTRVEITLPLETSFAE